MGKRRVPVLITGDVDYSTHHAADEKGRSFESLLAIGRELGIPFTFFFVAREAEQVADQPSRLREAGHEIGCHGLTHGDEEEYSRMPEEMQRRYLEAATTTLKRIAGTDIVSFRAPRVKISATTFAVLASAGYQADSSVCSQRCDLVSSNGVNTGWLRAPRTPYHPSPDDPYRRGDMPILEIPISALGLPFISSALYVLGVPFMKLFLRSLVAESRRTGKPIVYLFHPYEFAAEIPGAKSYHRNVRVHGLRLRRHFYRGTPETKLAATRELLNYARTFPDVRFMTVGAYARTHASA